MRACRSVQERLSSLLHCALQTFCMTCEVVGLHAAGVRERVENLYFAYLFVLRATLKAAPLLEEVAYDTGFPQEDARTAELVRKLVRVQHSIFALAVLFMQCKVSYGVLHQSETGYSVQNNNNQSLPCVPVTVTLG